MYGDVFSLFWHFSLIALLVIHILNYILLRDSDLKVFLFRFLFDFYLSLIAYQSFFAEGFWKKTLRVFLSLSWTPPCTVVILGRCCWEVACRFRYRSCQLIEHFSSLKSVLVCQIHNKQENNNEDKIYSRDCEIYRVSQEESMYVHVSYSERFPR
jgi:hypothetical protein